MVCNETGYDYIFTGAGCAGLSLLVRILVDPAFRQKKILVIDKDEKETDDRTWCFWEEDKGLFEDLVCHSWQQLDFRSPHGYIAIDISPLSYKMIRSIDFYRYAKQIINRNGNVDWVKSEVEKIYSTSSGATVKTANAEYRGRFVFNSIIGPDLKKKFTESNAHKLSQHFKGWFIQTPVPVFNAKRAGFMDFRIPQDQGTAFVYLLPITADKALVEYTFFNDKPLISNAYDALLKDYLRNVLQLNAYEVVGQETGNIPMTDFPFPIHDGNIIHIGTAGGWTKPSSGFTFQTIQKKTTEIVNKLKNNAPLPAPSGSFWDRRFLLYDSVLLRVLGNGKCKGDFIFHRMFDRLPFRLVFAFLDNESNLAGEIRLMASMSTKYFLPAAIKEIGKRLVFRQRSN